MISCLVRNKGAFVKLFEDSTNKFDEWDKSLPKSVEEDELIEMAAAGVDV